MSDLILPNGAPASPPSSLSSGGSPAGDPVFDTTTATFKADVIDASMNAPVMVDFWAPWCGPCKQLTPTLEKAVRNAKGRIRLAKMNIDEHPEIPGQMGVQSIPAVVVFSKGQPVDGFMGAVPESQIKTLIERVAGPAEPTSDDDALLTAEEMYEAGDIPGAARLFAGVLQNDPQNATAIGGFARCLVQTGDFQQARKTLALAPPDSEKDPAIIAAMAALDLAESAAEIGDIQELEARLAANPTDHQARYDMAKVLHARGQGEACVSALLEIIRADRTWSDEAAKKLLFQFFEAWGPMSELTKDGRRRLSSVLFS